MSVFATFGGQTHEVKVRRYDNLVRLVIEQPFGSPRKKPYALDMTYEQWERLSAALKVESAECDV